MLRLFRQEMRQHTSTHRLTQFGGEGGGGCVWTGADERVSEEILLVNVMYS